MSDGEHENPLNEVLLNPLMHFARDSTNLINKCHKPDSKEFQRVATATAIGFAVMGMVGFFVKLIHIPINNILVGGGN